MNTSEIKKAAYVAAKKEDADLEKGISGMEPQDILYYLQMVYYYRLFDLGKIRLGQAKEIEQRVNGQHTRLENALRLSQESFQRQVDIAKQTGMDRTKLSKQLAAGDHGFLPTLLHILDLYSGEMVYCQMYRVMQPPMTDPELERMIAQIPEEYRRGMTQEEARAAVWNVVRQLNEEELP